MTRSVIDDVLLFSSRNFITLLNHMSEASVIFISKLFYDLRFQLLVVMFDSNVFKVSFDAVRDSFSKVFRLSSSDHVLLNVLWVLTLYQFVLLNKVNELKYIFYFDFPLSRKHCYLSSFQVLCLFITCVVVYINLFNFFVFFYDLVSITCLIMFIIFS